MTDDQEFIQCKNIDELEAIMKTLKTGFVTSDLRIYREIEMSDDACFYQLDAATVHALHDLQSSLEMVDDGSLETSFNDLVEEAKMLQSAYEKLKACLKFKPILRTPR